MNENEFSFHQQDNREIKRSLLDLGFEYEALLTIYKQNNSQNIVESIEKEIEPIDAQDRSIVQKLFVKPNNVAEIPIVGASQSTKGWELAYEACFVPGNTKQHGDIVVGHAKLKTKKGLRLEYQSYSLLAKQMSERYDPAIFQAVANTFELPILQSIQALSNYGKVELIKRGFTQRPGYPEVLDKVFNPQQKR